MQEEVALREVSVGVVQTITKYDNVDFPKLFTFRASHLFDGTGATGWNHLNCPIVSVDGEQVARLYLSCRVA